MNKVVDEVKIADYGKSVGMRELGKQIRETAIMAIGNNHKVAFNFSNVTIISSAFADEVFGKLYVELGETKLKENISVYGFDNDDSRNIILLIIKNAISYRRDNPHG